jgi:dimethylaniline monooxygenase (N-oxide forming)
VVGAGPSGLATVKELLAEGHEPVCFERAPDAGGVFRFDEEAGVVWGSCRLTSSGLLTAFSDFPAPPDRAGHMTAGDYVGYLRAYREAFDLDRHIRFGTAVERIERVEGGWRVVASDTDERFDAVAVCSGLHQHPHVPRFPGDETFPGRILHASRYRRPAEVAGNRVLVVGAGESGADVVAEVAEHAAETVLSLRRGVAVLPRRVRGHPNDYLTTRLANSPAAWIFQTRHPHDDGKRRVYRYAFLPLVVLDKLVQMTALAVRRRRLRGLDRATADLTQRLLRESGGFVTEQFGTKSDEFVRALAAGRARRAGAIDRFDGSEVVFEDGQRFAPDLVLFCTGFETQIPFLGELADEPRYLHTFVPSAGPSLGLIGFVRPAFGAIPPLAELQARWFALVQSGLPLPTAGEMRADAGRRAEERRRFFRAVRGRIDELVDFTPLCDELAERIGCKPTRAAVRELGGRFYAAPFVAAQYRLVGPHAQPEAARRVLASLPVAHARHEVATLRLRWLLSRALHRVLGPQYAPKLELGR